MESILITGGSGIIGREIISKIDKSKFEVRVLSRSKKNVDGCKVFGWDVDQEFIEDSALENLDHIIHLAGSNVSAGRWTNARKKEILDSRIKSIELINSKLKNPLKTFISASGSSYYGTKTVEQIFSEEDEIQLEASDFLGDVTHKWEAAALKVKSNRTVILRTPVVLSRTGGALEKLIKPIKGGIGSALGDGQQWMPWVHVDDLTNAYLSAIENDSMTGAYNVCATKHATNLDFTKAIARNLNKNLWAPKVPSFVLKAMFGQMSDIILKGSRVSGKKIKSTGYDYKFDNLDEALKDLLS